MRVLATVPESEVSVEIGADEIVEALFDMPNEKCEWVLSTIAGILQAVSDFQIREQLNPSQRALIRDSLLKQAARYKESQS